MNRKAHPQDPRAVLNFFRGFVNIRFSVRGGGVETESRGSSGGDPLVLMFAFMRPANVVKFGVRLPARGVTGCEA